MSHYDQRTDIALTDIVKSLDEASGLQLIEQLDKAADQTQERWDDMFKDDDTDAAAPHAQDRRPRRPGAGVGRVPNDEDGDAEHPDAPAATGALKIQKSIHAIMYERRIA